MRKFYQYCWLSFCWLSFLVAWMIQPVLAQDQPEKPVGELWSLLSKSRQDTGRVDLLLQLSDHYFPLPGRQKFDLDSAMVYARSAEASSITLKYQRGLGDSYEQISKILHIRKGIDSGKYYAGKAIDIFKANHCLMELGYAYYDLSGYYAIYDSDMDKRIRLVEQSLSEFQQARNNKKEADVHKELGDLKASNGDNSGALSDLRQAVQIYQAIDYPYLQGTYDLMGYILSGEGDFEQGLKYGLLAVAAAEQVKDTSPQMCTIYNRVGMTYERMKKLQPAYQYYLKSLAIAVKCKDTPSIVILTCNISHDLVKLNRPQQALALLQGLTMYPRRDYMEGIVVAGRFLEVYDCLNQGYKGQPYCDQLVKSIEVISKNYDDLATVYQALIKHYLANRQTEEARKYILILHALALRQQLPRIESGTQLSWFKLDSMENNYKSAIIHYQRHKDLEDSMLNERTGRQVRRLELEFETEKKDKDIALKEGNIELLTNQAQLQQNKLKQANFTRDITLAGLALLLGIIVLLYQFSRSRMRINRKLQDQQAEIQKTNVSLQHLVKEKDWLVKEIHHRVKNNFHIVNGLLAAQTGYLKNEEAINAIGESQHRVQAMSLIHQKLYQSESISAINISDYIRELVDYLSDSFNISKTIQFKLDIEPVELGLSRCIPLGLILNEAITNAIKYAFRWGQRGVISISLTDGSPNDGSPGHGSPRQLLLVVSDNGAGLPPGFDIEARRSMGMTLMQGLSEDMDGTFSIANHNGTEIRIAFMYDPEAVTEGEPVNFGTFSS
jgi:two-component sensor histidine kinase